jgi:hypothetical protein
LINSRFDHWMNQRTHVADHAPTLPASKIRPNTLLPLATPACACGGGCPRCRGAGTVQPRMWVGEAGDRLEQEAESLAAGMTQGIRSVARSAHGVADSPGLAPLRPERLLSGVGAGQTLPQSLRHPFEERLGHNLANVRVHNGADVGDSAAAMGAQAYTLGNDIVFAPGQYAPETTQGHHLLAHELTHVVQQTGKPESVGLSPAKSGGMQRNGMVEAWRADLAQRKSKVKSLAKQGDAALSYDVDPASGKARSFQLTQNFGLELDSSANASDYAVVQWIKGELFELRGKDKVYWPASMGLFGRKNTDPFLFTDWVVDTPDADPRFGSHYGLTVTVPVTKIEDSPGVLTQGVLPAGLTYDISARMGVYPWGSRIPTDIAGWQSQKPEPFMEVQWGWKITVAPDQKNFDITVK